MKLYSLYTPSHKIFLDEWFLSSLQDDYELIIEKHNQESVSSAFMDSAWKECMFRKIDLIISAIKQNWDGSFIFSDVDIQFFGKTEKIILDIISKFDFVAQKDAGEDINLEICPDLSGHLCTGFFICKGNERTIRLWEEVKLYCLKDKSRHDQHGLNYFLNGFNSQSKDNLFGIKWDYLPPEFYSPGPYLGTHIWQPGEELIIPDNILLHHANWTSGIKNKIAQLKYVKEVVLERQ